MERGGKKEKKNPAFFLKAGVLALFLLLQVYFIFIKTHPTLDINVWPNEKPGPDLVSGERIGQTFVAKTDNLSRVEIMLGTHDRQSRQDILFKLFAVQSGRDLLVEKTFNASEVVNNRFHQIDFEPIRESRDRKYYFELISPGSKPEEAFCIWMNSRNIYRPGERLLNNKVHKGDLIFRIYSQRPIYSELGRIVKNYPGILGKTWFLIVTIIFFEAAQFLILVMLMNYFEKFLRKENNDSG